MIGKDEADKQNLFVVFVLPDIPASLICIESRCCLENAKRHRVTVMHLHLEFLSVPLVRSTPYLVPNDLYLPKQKLRAMQRKATF